MQKETRKQEIVRLCDENGLKPAEVLREAKIPYATMQNWEEDPKAFQTYDKIKETITALAASKSESL